MMISSSLSIGLDALPFVVLRVGVVVVVVVVDMLLCCIAWQRLCCCCVVVAVVVMVAHWLCSHHSDE